MTSVFFRSGSLLKLAVVQFGIETVLCQQFFVRALLHNVPVVEDQDLVCRADGGQTVGNDEGGASFHEIVHGVLDQMLGAGIHG